MLLTNKQKQTGK